MKNYHQAKRRVLFEIDKRVRSQTRLRSNLLALNLQWGVFTDSKKSFVSS
jgi:hypothetical protein